MAAPPQLGFNNNVRHMGRIFHIQTEDSGVQRPRIVTHLFADGGRIIKTTRTDYSEHVGREDMAVVVRRLMKEQHKAMFIALRAGELDGLLDGSAESGPVSMIAPEVPGAQPEEVQDFGEVAGEVGTLPGGVGVLTDEAWGGEVRAKPARAQTSKPPPRRARSSGAPEQRMGRYAASRPAAIFGEAPPSKSIFGDEVITEKSLDDVILSYLAEDADEPSD